MPAIGVHDVEIVFLLLLLFVVLFGALAKKLNTPYPIVMVIGGLLLSFVPHLPPVVLSPSVIFFIILPPLLYGAAWVTSWRDFSYHLVSICFLAFGLVGFTVLAVTQAGQWLLPGFDWRVGVVLGAIVAPTDAIAATSIARRVGLPRRIIDILEGESLINDATALLALEFGLGLLVGGRVPAFTEGFLRLAYLTATGIAVGLAIGEIVHRAEHLIDDGPIEIALSILTPYVAFLAAEQLHASGVLAVVSCGLYLSRKSAHFFSPSVRLQAWAVWDSLTFILNGLVFVLIGLQMHYVREAITGVGFRTLFLYGAGFSALLIVLRIAWMYPGAYFANVIRRRLLHQNERMPTGRQIFIVGWTGMRGVISLSAAIALPNVLANGEPFAQRNMIIFLTFSVILVTLVLQGLTLPPLIRALKLAITASPHGEEKEARRQILEAALAYLEAARDKAPAAAREVYRDLEQHYRHRLAGLTDGESAEDGIDAGFYRQFVDLSRELLVVERQEAVRLRNQRHIGDEVLREIEREIDLSDARLRSKSPASH